VAVVIVCLLFVATGFFIILSFTAQSWIKQFSCSAFKKEEFTLAVMQLLPLLFKKNSLANSLEEIYNVAKIAKSRFIKFSSVPIRSR
jgi:hypothetical protein